MRRCFSVVMLMLFFLIGCAAHNESYNYADYSNSLIYDMAFYSQYEIVYKVKTENGEKTIVSAFASDRNEYLPKDVSKLHLGIRIINPQKTKFVVWMDYEFIGIENEFSQRSSRIVHMSQSLPEEFISIDLPVTNIHSQVKFSVSISNRSGVLYESSEALYKMGVNNKKGEKV